ncbi:hypothetical protein [Novosphingobium acidiphilum]|jgi:hypothetical protein|uniref:hypothetical protein n=1 Tax=Novosphingobium acidiphilum TaxID=505248 RepID=UPI00041E0DD7|nr:hypothetical protein [Novosphingobium acidiphilum]
MTQDSFEDACDRLSQGIDAVQFERLRWSKTEGPMLARLVELVHLAIADRDEFELSEEGASSDIKRFVLKVHANRVAGIVIRLDNGRASVAIEDISRSRYAITPAEPVTADFAQADAQWMATALKTLFGRIRF